MYSILLDNSGIRRLALKDPSASLTNRAIRKHQIIPVLSYFAIGEIVKGLVSRPFDEELCRRCEYLLRLENLFFPPDVPDGIEAEYKYEGHETYRSKDNPKCRKAIDILRQCAIGAVPPSLKKISDRHHASERRQAEEYIGQIRASPDIGRLKFSPLEEIATEAQVSATASKVLLRHFDAQGLMPLPEATERVAQMAGKRPRSVPYLAASARIQIWANWYVAQNGRIPKDFQSDLRFLVLALAGDAVLTADKRMLLHGPSLFPEVRFLDAACYAAHLERFA